MEAMKTKSYAVKGALSRSISKACTWEPSQACAYNSYSPVLRHAERLQHDQQQLDSRCMIDEQGLHCQNPCHLEVNVCGDIMKKRSGSCSQFYRSPTAHVNAAKPADVSTRSGCIILLQMQIHMCWSNCANDPHAREQCVLADVANSKVTHTFSFDHLHLWSTNAGTTVGMELWLL
jgi:hypothetical protein